MGLINAARELFSFGVNLLVLPATETDPRLTRWSQLLGEVFVALGRHALARTHLERALGRLGAGAPQREIYTLAASLVQVTVQVWHRMGFVNRLVGGAGTIKVRSAEAYEQLGYVYYASGSTLLGIHAALRLLNLSERAAPSPVLARAYAAMSLTVSVTPLRSLGDFYERAARAVCAALGENLTTGWVGWISSIRAAGEGRWPDLFAGTSAAIDASANASDQRLWVMATLTRAWGIRAKGQTAESRKLASAALEVARSHGNHLWEA